MQLVYAQTNQPLKKNNWSFCLITCWTANPNVANGDSNVIKLTLERQAVEENEKKTTYCNSLSCFKNKFRAEFVSNLISISNSPL